MALGFWLGRSFYSDRSVAQVAAAADIVTDTLPTPMLNDLFVRGIEPYVRLGLVGWAPNQRGVPMFEIDPESLGLPDLWSSFSPSERCEIFRFLAASYSQIRLRFDALENGKDPDVSPPFGLRRKATGEVLAARDATGAIGVAGGCTP